MMEVPVWTTVAIWIVWGVMVYVGLRYPRPEKDWPYGLKRTTRILLSFLIFILMAILIYAVSLRFALPSPGLIFTYLLMLALVILILYGIFHPEGLSKTYFK